MAAAGVFSLSGVDAKVSVLLQVVPLFTEVFDTTSPSVLLSFCQNTHRVPSRACIRLGLSSSLLSPVSSCLAVQEPAGIPVRGSVSSVASVLVAYSSRVLWAPSSEAQTTSIFPSFFWITDGA